MRRSTIRHAGERFRTPPRRSLPSSVAVIVAAVALSGCHAPKNAHNDKGVTWAGAWGADNGQPAGETDKVEPGKKPIGPKTYALYREISVGLTPAEVEAKAGKPTQAPPPSTQPDGKYESYIYTFPEDGRVDCIFKNGKLGTVTANGPDAVNPKY